MKIGLITENFQQHYECGEIFHKLKQIGYDGVDYTLSLTYNKPEEIFSKPRSEWTKYFKHIADELKNNEMLTLEKVCDEPENSREFTLVESKQKSELCLKRKADTSDSKVG